MFEYKTEALVVPYKMIKKTFGDDQFTRIDELINQRASDGWQLITHCISSMDDINGATLLITFGKEK
jgi:hypothetical protein